MAGAAQRARGEAIRAAIARAVLPRLVVGSEVPSSKKIGRALRMPAPGAYVQLARVLKAAGIRTERRYRAGGPVCIVVEIMK